MEHSKEVSIIFLKNGWWQNSIKFREKKRYRSWSIFWVFHKFQGDSRFYTKFQAISRVQGVKINSRLLKGFKKPWEPWPENATCQDVSYHCERSPYTYTPEALYGVRHHCLQTIGIYRNFIYVSFIFFLFEVGQKGRKINVFLLTNSSSISHKKTLYI